MAGTISKLAGPVALANATYVTDIFNESSALLSSTVTHIRVNNTTAGALTFQLFKGLTGANAAGTNFCPVDFTVAANGVIDWYMANRFESTDFLVGGASGAGLVIIVEGTKNVK